MDRLKINVEYQNGFEHIASVVCVIILPVNQTTEAQINYVRIDRLTRSF